MTASDLPFAFISRFFATPIGELRGASRLVAQGHDAAHHRWPAQSPSAGASLIQEHWFLPPPAHDNLNLKVTRPVQTRSSQPWS